MSTTTQNKPFKIPLRLVLIVPFVIQIVVVVGLVGYISFKNGQRAVNNVAHQLRSEITARIEEHLRTLLATPHHINQANANVMHQGLLEANNPTALERYLWEQIQVFDSVSSVYFGNIAGGLVNAGREGAGGPLYIIVTDEFTRGPFRKYATDSNGKRTDLLVTVPDFDARTRSWYSDAVAKDDATWSDVYILFTGQDMAISASRPVYDAQQTLLGVVSNDIFVSHISDFMEGLEIGETGASFIVERSGLLIASSTSEKPFTDLDENIAPTRLEADHSTIPAIRYAAEFLTAQFGDYHNITEAQQLEFEIDGQRQFLQVAPVQDEYGIDWLVVVVIPESDFMAQIDTNNRTTAFLVGVALLAATGVSIITAQGITRPILRLHTSTQALASGEWHHTLSATWISEIDGLTHAFNNMAGQLKHTVEGLTAEIAERERAEEALRESEKKYRSLIEQSNDAIYWLYENRFEIINPKFTELFGVTLEEIDTPDFDFMHLVAPQSRPLIAERISDLAQGRKPDPHYAFTAQDKEGREIEVEVSVAYIPYRDGTAIQGILRDVTARKQLEQQLHRHAQLAAVGQLAAGIAHDFRNMLTIIILYTNISLRQPNLPPKLVQNLKTIIGESQKAADLVQQILDFSSRAMIARRPLDLAALTREVLDVLRRTIPENIRPSLEVRTEERAAPLTVRADPGRIQQVLTNLATNARDAMPRGGELRFALSRVEVIAGAIPPVADIGLGMWVCLAVSDTGTGMTETVRAHLFEPFFTTKEVGQGTGLGLAQVYGIVRQHEGYIDVETEVGRGTTFRIYLPAYTEEVPADTLAPLPAPPQGQGETLLLVEDNQSLREATQSILEALGYRVLTAANGRLALEVYQTAGGVDLVITDIVMPEMGGGELMRELSRSEPNLKALGITGYAVQEVAEKLREAGFLNVIHKPFNVDVLAQMIRHALDERVPSEEAG